MHHAEGLSSLVSAYSASHHTAVKLDVWHSSVAQHKLGWTQNQKPDGMQIHLLYHETNAQQTQQCLTIVSLHILSSKERSEETVKEGKEEDDDRDTEKVRSQPQSRGRVEKGVIRGQEQG